MTLLIVLLLVAMLGAVVLGTNGESSSRELDTVAIPVRVDEVNDYFRSNYRL